MKPIVEAFEAIFWEGLTLIFQAQGTKAVVDGKMMEMGAPAICNNGRVFASVRFLAGVSVLM